jgi:methyl-accepting chemotaxis protein
MKNIKLGPKLIVSFLFTAILTAFMGIYLIEKLKYVDGNSEEIYEKALIPLGLLAETGYLAQEMRIQAREWKLAKTDEGRVAALKTLDGLNAALKDLIEQQKDRVIHELGKRPLNEMLAVANNFTEEMHAFAKTHTDRCPLSGITTADFTPSLLNAGAELRNAFGAAKDMRTGNANKLSAESREAVSKATTLSIQILIAVLLISIALGIFLTRSTLHPLNIVVEALSKIEKGDMTVRVNLDRKDELGILSKALDSLSAKLQSIFRNLRQNSDTLAGSAEELSSIGRQVVGATEQVATNISAMASGAEEASVNTNEVAGSAEQMSTNMNTIASAVEEMSASISQISGNAGEANKVASEATAKACEATEVMNKLGAAAKEIGQVTDVIKKIADKTNLLALNATIEAASAGEAGKGFAVVAGEIKELANQSSKSADDIAHRIDSIQVGTNNAVAVISGVSDIITRINQSVEAISNHVDQQTKASNEISSNVAQANIGAKRVASAVSEVAKGSRDIARNAGEAAKNATSLQGAKHINQGADELAKMASDLKSVLSQFKV